MNGGRRKHSEELKFDMENLTLKDMCKDGCKKFGQRDYYKNAKIYNKNGVLLFESDIGMIAPGDILYIACEGKS